jgi:hypothetical protein
MLLKIAGWSSAALLVLAWFKGAALPQPSYLLPELSQEPLQTIVQPTPYQVSAGKVNYSIKPLYDYEIRGLVVSKHNADAWWDWIHAAANDHINVVDLCVVWGANATAGTYLPITFSSGQWTCNFETRSTEAFQAFNQSQISNNHLLTDSPALARKLRNVRIGDQISVKGQLVEYRHQAGMDFFRGTSTVRTDTGNGACETIFASEVTVLKSAPMLWRALSWAAMAILLLCLGIGFFQPHRATS